MNNVQERALPLLGPTVGGAGSSTQNAVGSTCASGLRGTGGDEIRRVAPQGGDCFSSACGGLIQQLLAIVGQLFGALTGEGVERFSAQSFSAQDPDGDLSNDPFPQLPDPDGRYLLSSQTEL